MMLSQKVHKRKNFIIPKHHDRWLVTEKEEIDYELSGRETAELNKKIEALKMLRFFYGNVDPEYSKKRLSALEEVAIKLSKISGISTKGFIVSGSASMGLAIPVSDSESYIVCSKNDLSRLGYKERDTRTTVTINSKGDLTILQKEIAGYLIPIMGHEIDIFLLGIIDSDKLNTSYFEEARLIAASLTGIWTQGLDKNISDNLKNNDVYNIALRMLKLHFERKICQGYGFSLLKKYPSRVGYRFDELPKDVQSFSKIIINPMV